MTVARVGKSTGSRTRHACQTSPPKRITYPPLRKLSQGRRVQQAESGDGQHDFDFNFGTWQTHIKRLGDPSAGSAIWVELNGTVTVRKVWNGRGQLEEIEADGPAGHWEGLTLFLYNPQSHQWSQSYANQKEGALNAPSIGEFKNGRGELFDQETYQGRATLVRIVWSDITPNAHHFEQSSSEDGGKTWEPNFAASLTREKP